MNIFYFERMRVFTCDGARLILKLRLPRMGVEPFDRLYAIISGESLSLAESLSARGISGTLSVSFRVVPTGDLKLSRRLRRGRDSLVVIERAHRLSLSSGDSTKRYIDIFDTSRNALVR